MAAKQYDYFPLFAQYAHNRHASQIQEHKYTNEHSDTVSITGIFGIF